MEYQDYNNNPKPQITKKILALIFTGAIVLAFFFGFMFNYIIRVKPTPIVNEPEKTPYTVLYDFLDKNYYKPVDPELAFYEQLKSLVTSLNDPYTSINFIAMSSGPTGFSGTDYDEEHFEGLGVSFLYENFEMIISEVMRHSPAEKAFIYPGDKIIGAKVDGVETIFKDKALDQEMAIPFVKGVAGDVKTLIIKRLDNSIVELTVTYERFRRPTVESKLLDLKNGYIKISEFQTKTALVFKEHLEELEKTLKDDTQTLIIDLRNNPGGLLSSVVSIIQQLVVNEPRVVGIKSAKTNLTEIHGGGLESKKPYNIKVLVNESSASASEMLAAALHYTGGYEIFGAPTFGKNVYQVTRTFELTPQVQLSLRYTEGYWFYGDFQIMDKDTNPIPVTKLEKTGFMAIYVPYYLKTVSLDEVNVSLISAQKFLNVYYDLTLREDGYFDLDTQTAITRYQGEKLIPVTNQYDLKTSQTMYTDYFIKIDDQLTDNQITALMS